MVAQGQQRLTGNSMVIQRRIFLCSEEAQVSSNAAIEFMRMEDEDYLYSYEYEQS